MDDGEGIGPFLLLKCFIYWPIIEHRYSQVLRLMICLCFCLGNDFQSCQLCLSIILDGLYHLKQFEQILYSSSPLLLV